MPVRPEGGWRRVLAQGCHDPAVPYGSAYWGAPAAHTRAREVVGAAESVKVFGRRPSRTFPRALRPASENLQGTKPRERARIGRCRVLSYGDLAVGVPQLRSAARRAERWGWRCSSVGRRFSDLRAGMSLKIGAAVAWWTQRWSELSRGRLRSDQTGERFRGGGCEIVIMRCRS